MPHPDGPMIAVTALRSIENSRFRSTWRVAVGEAEAADVHRRAPRARPAAAEGGRGASVALGVGTNEGLGFMMALIRISP